MPKAVALTAIALILACPLLAHHSFAAEFDGAKQVALKGVVTKVEWMNPHIWIYVDVPDENGRTVNWALEVAGPNSMSRRGWSRNALKQGDHVAATAYRARDGSPVASARSIVLPDGRTVFTGVPNDGGPQN
jgi:hypothetical protein